MSDRPQKQSNRPLWIGLAFVLLSILSNLLSFFKLSPALLPWVILILPILALIFLLIGVVRAYRQPQIYRGKIWGSIVTVLAVLLAAASTLFFVNARKLPSSGGAPQVGQRVPDFTLLDSTGQPTSLAQLFSVPASASAPPPKAVLLVFYRGYWWPFCNLELRGIQDRLPEFAAQGVRPVAISVDAPEVSENLRKKQGYTFTFLSDPQTYAIRRYDLLHKAGGPEEHDISRPAEFLVDRSGTVRWENFTEDIRVRPRAQQMLQVAQSLRW